jgi:gamma-glutamyltranspeptidase
MHFVFRGEEPHIAIGCISDSVVEAAFQLLINLLDYRMNPREAAMIPRFGSFAQTHFSPLGLRLNRNRLDSRIDTDIVKGLKKKGIRVTQKTPVETGLGAILALYESGIDEGVTIPLPDMTEPFEISVKKME